MRCDDGAESEEQGEAGTKLDHVDSNVGNECEDAGDSDEGERTTQGNDAGERRSRGRLDYIPARMGRGPMADDRHDDVIGKVKEYYLRKSVDRSVCKPMSSIDAGGEAAMWTSTRMPLNNLWSAKYAIVWTVDTASYCHSTPLTYQQNTDLVLSCQGFVTFILVA